MNKYVTGTMIKRLRENRKMTQLQLAERLRVSDKAISKWETGRGYPDIALIEPLAEAQAIKECRVKTPNITAIFRRKASF